MGLKSSAALIHDCTHCLLFQYLLSSSSWSDVTASMVMEYHLKVHFSFLYQCDCIPNTYQSSYLVLINDRVPSLVHDN